MEVIGSFENILTELHEIMNSKPAVTIPKFHRTIAKDEEEENNAPCQIIFGCYFTYEPVIMYGVINNQIDEGCVYVVNKVEPSEMMNDYVNLVEAYFPDSTLEWKRNLIFVFGNKFNKVLRKFDDMRSNEMLDSVIDHLINYDESIDENI
ncbi:hypothetical protein [Chengkuizengella axinellae]|uniref:Immunity protein 63 domain-containing protein n=1 Tax=Chengkuizengella axinellae TaxID=3064388 RepID=A0ABT9J167_9BACL|nr:hypothetical protein [Chengkuizengella sp. 2205SS18-9]MDP5275366.1 hypothetical protein [Chengkuizengella sp. 2205SS18-9]